MSALEALQNSLDELKSASSPKDKDKDKEREQLKRNITMDERRSRVSMSRASNKRRSLKRYPKAEELSKEKEDPKEHKSNKKATHSEDIDEKDKSFVPRTPRGNPPPEGSHLMTTPVGRHGHLKSVTSSPGPDIPPLDPTLPSPRVFPRDSKLLASVEEASPPPQRTFSPRIAPGMTTPRTLSTPFVISPFTPPQFLNFSNQDKSPPNTHPLSPRKKNAKRERSETKGLSFFQEKKLRLPYLEETNLKQAVLQKARTGELSSEEKKEIKKAIRKLDPMDSLEILEILEKYTKDKKGNRKFLPEQPLDLSSMDPSIINDRVTFSQQLLKKTEDLNKVVVVLLSLMKDSLYTGHLQATSFDLHFEKLKLHVSGMIQAARNHLSQSYPLGAISKESYLYNIYIRTQQPLNEGLNPQEVNIQQQMKEESQKLFLLKRKLCNNAEISLKKVQRIISLFISSVLVQDKSNECCCSILCYIRVLLQVLQDVLNDPFTFHKLSSKSVDEFDPKKFLKDSSQTNIWFEPPEPHAAFLDPNDPFRAGTINNLVVRVTSDAAHEFVTCFLNTYPSFTDSHTLFNKLMERYQPPPNFVSSDENLVNITKKRVATLMLQWVTRDVDLLDTILIQKITNFAEVKLPQDKLESIGQRICQQLKKAESAKNSSSNYKPPEIIIYNLPQISVSKLFFSAHPVDIAEQLTLLDLEIFSRIELSELIGQRWVKESTQILSSNVVQLICKVNRLAFWVGTMILLQVKVADRVDAIKFFVSVAQNLFQKNNFNSLLGILAGLNLASITRLQITLNNLPKKTTELMEYLFTIQDPSSSFKHLREAKKKAGFNAVPYLGLNLQDLTRIDEGNATELIVSGLNLINFPKFSLNETATSDLLIHQKAIDNFKISKLEPLFTFLGELPALTEKELHSMSLEREPKGCTAKDVI